MVSLREHDARDAAAAGGLAGGGEMAALVRAHDWAATPLGPVDSWPPSLACAVDLCLDGAFATFVWWGSDLVQLYNDAARALLGPTHPAALGQPARAAWAAVWPALS